MRAWNIGIVGGGPGGLMTAYMLQSLANVPYRLTLFEASGRLGGKILSPRFDQIPVQHEAGAAEFYDYSLLDEDPLKELIAELGLPIRPMGGPAVIMNERILANLDDVRDELGLQASGALAAFDRLAKDRMTVQEFYHSDAPEGLSCEPNSDYSRFDAFLTQVADPESRSYLETMIHSDLATEPHSTNLEYGLQNYLMNDPAYMQLYGIEGGNERLPRELAARLEADILLEHCVRSIGKTSNGRLRVRSVHRETTRDDEFDFVVVALPHNRLLSVAYEGEPLDSAVRAHHAYYNYPAHYLRITLLFDKPFWREAFTDSYWMLDRLGGCCLYDESSREPESTHGVLGWLLGGAAAKEMSLLSDEQLMNEALHSLPDFLAHGRQTFIEGRVYRWIDAVNAMPGGAVPRSLDRRHQLEPREHANLFVVGDYLFDSTLNGVLDSATYVADWLAASMNDNLEKAL